MHSNSPKHDVNNCKSKTKLSVVDTLNDFHSINIYNTTHIANLADYDLQILKVTLTFKNNCASFCDERIGTSNASSIHILTGPLLTLRFSRIFKWKIKAITV